METKTQGQIKLEKLQHKLKTAENSRKDLDKKIKELHQDIAIEETLILKAIMSKHKVGIADIKKLLEKESIGENEYENK